MKAYASLQLLLGDRIEAAQERIIYAITSHMDARGYTPCARERAERTIAFAPDGAAWAVFDDSADRLDIPAMDGLACTLTRRLRVRAVGVLGSRQGCMLRLYADGHLHDTFVSAPGAFHSSRSRLRCRGHAIHWCMLLRSGSTVGQLTAAFARAQHEPEEGLESLCRLLSLGPTALYGYSSLEDARPQGLVTLYFCSSNHVRQHWLDRLLRPVGCAQGLLGALFRRPDKPKS